MTLFYASKMSVTQVKEKIHKEAEANCMATGHRPAKQVSERNGRVPASGRQRIVFGGIEQKRCRPPPAAGKEDTAAGMQQA